MHWADWTRLALAAALAAALACHAGAAPQFQVESPPGFRIELEDYDTFHPEGFYKFRKRRLDVGASDGQPAMRLARTMPKAHMIVNFRTAEGGRHRVWLRYATPVPDAIGFAFDPKDPARPDLSRVELPATGDYEGYGNYKWAQLADIDLAPGAHVLAIGRSDGKMYPDCLFFTTSAETPTDTVAKLVHPSPPTPEEREMTARPLGPIAPDWLREERGFRVPEWFEADRVHVHTRLPPQSHDKPFFYTAAEGFASLGVKVFTRHIKSRDEGAWWDSAVGETVDWAKGENVARRLIDNAHKAGCRIIAYHRHMEDAPMAEAHPDWVCRDWFGNVSPGGRGLYMCFNSPYADYFETRLLELVAMGADGFYFDETHMPKVGCWCSHCRKKFTGETGLEHPDGPFQDDPRWHRLIDFNNLTVERTFLRWRRAVRRANPEVVMIVSSNYYPTFYDRHMNSRLYRISDSHKTELHKPYSRDGALFSAMKGIRQPEREPRLAFGYTFSRDVADGRPAHVWGHALDTADELRYAAAAIMAYGNIANLDMVERAIPDANFLPAIRLSDRVSPPLSRTRPMKWAAVHFSEWARDEHYPTDKAGGWKNVLYPLYGAFVAFWRAGLPVCVVTDSHLELGDLEGHEVLFLPAPGSMTEAMERNVEAFRRRGGLVISQRSDWEWHTAEGAPRAGRALLAAAAPKIGAARAQVLKGERDVHSCAFVSPGGERVVVALANQFAWVRDERLRAEGPKPVADQTGIAVLLRNDRPPRRVFDAVTGAELEATKSNGAWRVSAPAFDAMSLIVFEF